MTAPANISPLCNLEEVPYNLEAYEEAIQTLDAATKIMRDYARALNTLEEKIEAHRHVSYIERARMNLRRHYYDQEDAINEQA